MENDMKKYLHSLIFSCQWYSTLVCLARSKKKNSVNALPYPLFYLSEFNNCHFLYDSFSNYPFSA